MAELGVGGLGGVGLGGRQVVAGLNLPGGDGYLLLDAQAFQFIADNADALVQKIHRCFPFCAAVCRGLTPFVLLLSSPAHGSPPRCGRGEPVLPVEYKLYDQNEFALM